MKNTIFKLLFAGLLASTVVTAGCVAQTPNLDQKFGEAVTTAKAQQIINPDASQNTNPVAGIDGQAANSAVDLYHQSFEKPPAPVNVFTIGVGSSSGTSR